MSPSWARESPAWPRPISCGTRRRGSRCSKAHPGSAGSSRSPRSRASLSTRGRRRGVPGDLAALARSGVLSPSGLARATLDLILPPTTRDGDVAVATGVGARFGHEVVDRLVEPLLGGVYAGRADELSFEATLPGLAAAVPHHRTLTGAARSVLAAARSDANRAARPAADPGPDPSANREHTARGGHGAVPARPVFTTLARGLGTLPDAVAAASGAQVRTGTVVRELRRTAQGWQLTVGSADNPHNVSADAV